MKAEFIYISDIVCEFFDQECIQGRLNIIDENNITGWENWLQIELSYFLSNHISDPEWSREWGFGVDGRKEKTKQFVKPDFLIRKKGWALNRYSALELKLHHSPVSCISNVFSDFDKVRKIKRSEIDLRSYWGLGVCKSNDTEYIKEWIQEKSAERGYNIKPNVSVVSNIGDTSFSYFLI